MGRETGTVGRDALAMLEGALDSLSPAHRKVAHQVLAGPERAIHQSVTELAEAAGTSTATVVRACQELGFVGFQDLKLAIAQSLGHAGTSRMVVPDLIGATPAETLDYTAKTGQRALADLLANVDPLAFAGAVEALSRSGRIVAYGAGTASVLAGEAVGAFVALGWPTEAHEDVMRAHVAARTLRPGDVFLGISVNGATVPTITAARFARDAGATVVVITGPKRSPLSGLADHVLTIGEPESGPWHTYVIGTARRTAAFRLVHALATSVAGTDPDRAEAAFAVMRDISVRHHE